MTRDQAFIRACDEVNKARALTDAEVTQLCAAIERASKPAREAERLRRARERYRTDPAYRAHKIALAKGRYHSRKQVSA